MYLVLDEVVPLISRYMYWLSLNSFFSIGSALLDHLRIMMN